ncbi:MAG: LpqB family beta-propeller domain-containing protein [Actinomycetota bacterium]|nr:LpqB family beta-propeller domain-containing protein [Actinomycetota bacterium]MDQ2958947.1 LpqB family beta-propeller domain-containing protein [Actinomycetota bacterium]
MTGRRARWLAALAIASALLAGCTTIPSSSSPQVVRTMNHGSSAQQPSITPEPGESPRDIVNGFLAAGTDASAGHSSSRQFLTTPAARKWQDTTTIVFDATTVSLATFANGVATLSVTGKRVYQIDQTGVLSPVLKNMGLGEKETLSYVVRQTGGQWRIDQLPQGVLISIAQFSTSYNKPVNLYFFDAAERRLVADPRYTPLKGQALADWLLAELVAGPRPELAQSVVNEVPAQVGKPTVQLGDPIVVEIPGSTQLDATARDHLAAQLAFTIDPFPGTQLELTDSGRPVRVMEGSEQTFSSLDYSTEGPGSMTPDSQVHPYYLHDGAVINGAGGAPVAGYLGQPDRRLSSVAFGAGSAGAVQVAGISDGSLLVGNESRLTKVPLPTGELSRPEWRPHAGDVWVGLGTRGAIYRTTPGQQPKAVSITSLVGTSPVGQVLAVRFSPDGVRLAVVIQAPSGVGTLWVGSVVTSGDDVQIDSFEPLTPPSLAVTDVAWADATTLLMVAASPNDAALMWRMYSDGSNLKSIFDIGLPGPPTAIAAATGQAALLSASDSIWIEGLDFWASYPNSAAPTPGTTSPIYGP